MPVRLVSLADAHDRTAVGLQEAADLVVVGCAEERDQALELIGDASQQRSDRPVVALYSGTPNGFLERAFEAGADDLITLPQNSSQLAFAFEKALARRRGAAPTEGPRRLVTVLGPKGGTGKTLTSCNVAVALALAGASTVIVDLDLQFGDVGLALGLRRSVRSTTSRSRAARSTATRSTASSPSIRPAHGRCSRRCGPTRPPR